MELLASLRSLPRAAWVLFAGTFINRFGTFVVPFLMLYLTRKGYAPAAAGAVVGVYGTGQLVASWLGGHLADRMGRVRTIALSMFGSAASITALSHAEGLAATSLLVFLSGATTELYRPAASALITDRVEPSQRVTAFAVYRLAINAGVMAGPATAGFLADRSFSLLFLGDALTSIVCGALVLLAIPHTAPPRAARGAAQAAPAGRALFADREFLRFLAASTSAALIFFQFESSFALHVQQSGHSSAVYGALMSVNAALVVLLEVPVTSFTRRLPPRRVISLGYLLIGIGFAMNLWTRSVPTLAAGIVVWTLGEIVSSPVSSAYVASLAPELLRGRYMGAWGLTMSIGLALAPFGGTAIFAWRPEALWLACGALGVLAAGILASGGPSRLPASGDRRP